jgi:hypothetical protein
MFVSAAGGNRGESQKPPVRAPASLNTTRYTNLKSAPRALNLAQGGIGVLSAFWTSFQRSTHVVPATLAIAGSKTSPSLEDHRKPSSKAAGWQQCRCRWQDPEWCIEGPLVNCRHGAPVVHTEAVSQRHLSPIPNERQGPEVAKVKRIVVEADEASHPQHPQRQAQRCRKHGRAVE